MVPIYCESNRHVTDCVTWPKRSRSWPRYLWSSISRQPCQIHGQFILTTNRKPHLGNPVSTWPMTSRDPKRSRSWPRYLWISISRLPCEIHGQFILTTSRKPHIDVTWPERSKSWPQYLWSLISQKTVRDRRSVVIDHLQETSCCESNGHVRDDVTWHQKVKVVAQISLKVNISTTVRDTWSVHID